MKRLSYLLPILLLSALMVMWGTNTAFAAVTASTNELIFSTVRGTESITKSVTIQNTGASAISVTALTFTGNDPGLFDLVSPPSLPATVQSSGTLIISVRFDPSSNDVGTFDAVLNIVSNDASSPTLVGVYGLSQQRLEGTGEPPLAWAVETLGYAINVGGTGLILNPADPFFAPLGDEVMTPVFERASSGNVTLTPVMRWSPNEALPFGWYTRNGNAVTHNQVDVVSLGQAQILLPTTNGGNTSFNPGDAHFGIYVESLSFGRNSYTEDDLNTGPADHAARVYPIKNRQGVLVPNTYLVVYEDAANGDYQDYGFVLTNVREATDDPPPPAAPTGLTISGSLSTVPVIPQYRWNHVSGATGYNLYVENGAGYISDRLFQVGVDITCTTTCAVNAPAGLPANGVYNWWVLASNAVGNGPWSEQATFTVTVPTPFEPSGLITNGSLVQPPVKPTFVWNHDGISSWYLLFINGPNGNILNQWYQIGNGITCSSTCTVNPNIALANGAYTWWVRGWLDIVGNGPWSVQATFNVAVPAPVEPTGLTTTGSLTVAPVTPAFQWNHNVASTWYLLFVNGPNGNILNQWYEVGNGITCSSTCSINPGISLGNGLHQWWVRGWNSTIGNGPWNTNTANFTVNMPAPVAPTGLTTLGSLTTAPVQPSFRWNHDGASTWYELYVSGPGGIIINQWFDVALLACTSTCTVNPNISFLNGNYQWWVRGWNIGFGSGAWNAVTANFTVAVTAPPVPTGLSASNTSGIPASPTFQWTHSVGTSWYALYISGPNGLVLHQWYEVGNGITCASTCSLTPALSLPAGAYQWWVRGWNATVGNGAWNPTAANFTVN